MTVMTQHAGKLARFAENNGHSSAVGSLGRLAYEADCRSRPNYDDGTPRKAWGRLGEVERWSWERNPTPRQWA